MLQLNYWMLKETQRDLNKMAKCQTVNESVTAVSKSEGDF